MSFYSEDDEQSPHPLDGGAAALPAIIGGGCLARFDPEDLNAESGADFSALWPGDSASPEKG
ncbi:hypothetical protein [Halopseudomonas laoshanensis]|uniref:hypothetical protein n=1 Tax=Halopseudomonas laoshanensis TaxID=2268758 RepID=UPI003734F24B